MDKIQDMKRKNYEAQLSQAQMIKKEEKTEDSAEVTALKLKLEETRKRKQEHVRKFEMERDSYEAYEKTIKQKVTKLGKIEASGELKK